MRIISAFGIVFVLFGALLVSGTAQTYWTLSRGASTFIQAGKFTVKFIEVVEDSRCPPDVQCIWAGNAKVKLSIAKGRSAARVFELNSNMEPTEVKYGGYIFKFVDLKRGPGEEPNDQIVKPTLIFDVIRAKK